MFKRICTEAGTGDSWTPRELRTTFVSLMSHHGVSIEEIARLVGHASTRTTQIVYRRELRPVITTGAEIMDQLFTGTYPRTGPRAAPKARTTQLRITDDRTLPARQPTAHPNRSGRPSRKATTRPPPPIQNE